MLKNIAISILLSAAFHGAFFGGVAYLGSAQQFSGDSGTPANVLDVYRRQFSVGLEQFLDDTSAQGLQLANEQLDQALLTSLSAALNKAPKGSIRPSLLRRLELGHEKLQASVDAFVKAFPSAKSAEVYSEGGVLLARWPLREALDFSSLTFLGNEKEEGDKTDAKRAQDGVSTVSFEGNVMRVSRREAIIPKAKNMRVGWVVYSQLMREPPASVPEGTALVYKGREYFGNLPRILKPTQWSVISENPELALDLELRPDESAISKLFPVFANWNDALHVSGKPWLALSGARVVSADAGQIEELTRTGDIQKFMLYGLLLSFVLHSILLFLSPRSLRIGVRRLESRLGSLIRGEIGPAAFGEAKYPASFRGIIKAINQIGERSASSPAVPASHGGPSIADVLKAQELPEGPEIDQIEFKGIADSGSLGIAGKLSADLSKEVAPFDDAKSYEPLDIDVNAALANAAQVEVVDELPPLPSSPDGLGLDGGEIDRALEQPFDGLMSSPSSTQKDTDAAAFLGAGLVDEAELGESDVHIDIPPQPSTLTEAPDALRAVYDEFMKTRASCGEGAALSYEKFRGRLEKTRAAVIAKHACPDVSFRVYVKAGKAALKATPKWS